MILKANKKKKILPVKTAKASTTKTFMAVKKQRKWSPSVHVAGKSQLTGTEVLLLLTSYLVLFAVHSVSCGRHTESQT